MSGEVPALGPSLIWWGGGRLESSPVIGPAEGSERGPLLVLAFWMTAFVGEWEGLELALLWERAAWEGFI